MINGFCFNVIAVKTGPVKFDREHQSKGGGDDDNRRVLIGNVTFIWMEMSNELQLRFESSKQYQVLLMCC